MFDKGIEKKRGPNRYPLATHEQAKRTIARLTRDVIHGRIDPEKCRAAIYCVNALIQIFKIEAPMKIDARFAGALRCEAPPMTLEDRKAELDKFEAELKTLIPGWDAVSLLESPLERAVEVPPESEAALETELAEARVRIEDTGAVWQPAGIGAKRRRK